MFYRAIKKIVHAFGVWKGNNQVKMCTPWGFKSMDTKDSLSYGRNKIID